MNDDRLNQFLWYGYFVDRDLGLPLALPGPDTRQAYAQMDEATLIQRGIDCWRTAIAAAWSESPRDSVVPLSGGLDSRAILAGLLEHTPARGVETYTYGTPGTWDFELGNRVAAVAGTRHYAYDLTRYEYSPTALGTIALRSGLRTTVFNHAPLAWIERDLGPEKRYWLGFMGDPLAGAHLPPTASRDWQTAATRFARRNRRAKSALLTRPGYRPEACLPDRPLAAAQSLVYDEQLDFGVRQQAFVQPHLLLQGLVYQLPFLQSSWRDYILSVPLAWRMGQRLYRHVLTAAYPQLFALPTKTNYGLALGAPGWARALRRVKLRAGSAARRRFARAAWGTDPLLNYVDFDQGLRHRTDLKGVVEAYLQAFQRRRVADWIDMAGLWRRHQRGQANHADALTLLASLEIILQMTEAPGAGV